MADIQLTRECKQVSDRLLGIPAIDDNHNRQNAKRQIIFGYSGRSIVETNGATGGRVSEIDVVK